MLRKKKLYKKKIYKKKIYTNLLSLYKNIKYASNLTKVNVESLYYTCFYLNLPKRQQIFSIDFLKTEKSINLTAGVLLKKAGLLAKHFKRNNKNCASIILHLKLLYGSVLKYVYMFYIKNFSYRQYFFFKKFLTLINPSIYFFIHKQSYIPRFLPKRRIKRRFLRMINKESKLSTL